ncbi:MAG TPA: hypothetical protein PLH33_04550, partial [Chitinophagaceae bacterium]|nr:hypothetical protein [Chitinophagaceae bacterium]
TPYFKKELRRSYLNNSNLHITSSNNTVVIIFCWILFLEYGINKIALVFNFILNFTPTIYDRVREKYYCN